MKPMALNMSKMKKVAGDKHSSTFQHADGHTIKVAHAALPALQRKQMEKLPIKMADGGPVDDLISSVKQAFSTPSPTPTPPSQDEKNDAIRKQNRQNFDNPSNDKSGGFAKGGMVKMMAEDGDPELAPSAPADTAQMQPGDTQGPQQPNNTPWTDPTEGHSTPASPLPITPDAPPASKPGPPSDVDTAYNMGLSAIDKQAKVNSQKADADAQILQDDATARKTFNDNSQANNQTSLDHEQAFMQDYAAGHINPNAYMENMGTGQKISTAIGLLLGGISMGAGGKSNPAMDFLNKQIERNIAAQQSDQDRGKTVLAANHELYGDQILAQNQTRINMNDMVSHNIDLAAAKLGTPQAQAQAQAAKAQFMLTNNNLRYENSIRQSVLQQTKTGGQGLTAHDLAQGKFMTPEEAEKEQGSIDRQKNAVAQVNNIFDQMDQVQHLGNRIAHPFDSYDQLGQLKAQLADEIMASSPSKRLNKEAIETQIEPFVTHLHEGAETRAKGRQGVLNIVKNAAEPTPIMNQYAKGSLPNYNVAQSQSADQQAAAYATSPATRNTPQAAAIRQKLGLK